MLRTAKNVSSALGLVALSACANANTAYRDFSVNDGSGAMIDIKQRAVIAAKRLDEDGQTKRLVVCAEPSPDAISAYAAEFAAQGGNGRIGAEVTAAMQEAAAYVGLRTQSIQLMRDSFYRICEGYMSGALTESQFDILTRRHQRYMVALLGIEQLTGAVKAPAVTLTSEGQASAARSLSSMRAELDAIDAELAKKKSEKDAQDAIQKDAAKPEPEKNVAKKRSEDLAGEIADLEKDRAAVEQGIRNARGLAAGGATYASVSPVGVLDTRSDATLEKVATEVGDIVESVLETNEFEELCLNVLAKEGGVDRLVARIASLGAAPQDTPQQTASKNAAGELISTCLALMNKNVMQALAR